MKIALIACTLSLGLATGAFARPSEFPSPWLPSGAPLPIALPELTLPSPCNSGAVVVLASRSDDEALPDLNNPGETGVGTLADYKCANSLPPDKSSDSRR
jgi:hypothetical protein